MNIFSGTDEALEIRRLEYRLAESRRGAASARAALKADVRAALTSPKALGAAFGFGFIVGEIIYRKKFKKSNAPSSSKREAKTAGSQSLTQLLALAYSLFNTWPVSNLISLLRNPAQTQSMGGATAQVAPTSTDFTATGIPATGIPATGIPATGVPATDEMSATFNSPADFP